MDDALQPTVGLLLRQRRQELEFSLADLAEKTRIRKAYLEALERDAFEALPGDAYRSGFLRSYADALGLDSDYILRRWREQTGPVDRGRTDHPIVSGSPVCALPRSRGRIILQIMSVLVIMVVVLYFSIGRRGEIQRNNAIVSTESVPPPSNAAQPGYPASIQPVILAGERARPEEVVTPLSTGEEDNRSIQQPSNTHLISVPEPDAGDRIPPKPSVPEPEGREANR